MGKLAYSIKNGLKQCNGRLCQGKWLPATEEFFYPRRAGILFATTFITPCIECRKDRELKRKRGTQKYVSVGKYMFVFMELERRIGRSRTEKTLHWQRGKMKRILEGRQMYVQHVTMVKAITLLKELRDNGSRV